MAANFAKTGFTMRNLLLCLSFVFVFLIDALDCDSEFEGLYHLPVEHSFDQGPEVQWSKRGVITIRSISNDMAQFVQSQPLSDAEFEKLKELAKTDGIYRLRVPVSLESTNNAQQYVTTYTKACGIYESSLSDQILLNAETNGNRLLGVSLTTALATCDGRPVRHRLSNWNSSVEIRQTVQAPVPDTASYIQKIEREKIAKAKGGESDNRSFIAKYWMYIVPAVILMMVLSNADQGQGQG